MNEVFLGDCRDTMRTLIADGQRVQCIVTSPPYWGMRDYGDVDQLGLEGSFHEFLANMVEVFELCRELLADDGVLWLNMGDSYATSGGSGFQGMHGQRANRGFTQGNILRNTAAKSGFKPKDLIGQPWRLAFALQDAGWWLRSDNIWHKTNPMPESVRDRCTKAHEYIFMLTKSQRYYFNHEAIMEPVSDATVARLAQNVASQKGSVRANGSSRADRPMKAVGNASLRNKRSVWSIATERFSGGHFAVMPRALVEPCILSASRPGDIVFDPFLGSGTAALVAQRLGRRWLGCELNPQYVEIIRSRTQQKGLEL